MWSEPAGAIFALKNIGWSDRQEVELQGSLASVDLAQLPDHLLARIANGEHVLSVLASTGQAALASGELQALPAGKPIDGAVDEE